MARSWASVARTSLPVEPKPSVLRASAPEWTPPPRCYYCGSAADICPRCADQRSWMPEHTLQPVVTPHAGKMEGRCADHGGWYSRPYALFNAKLEELIPQTCTCCRAKHPWRIEDHVQVRGFAYHYCSRSSPSPQPRFRFIRLGQSAPGPEVRAAEAEAAYKEELAYSGDKEKAERLKARVLSPSNGSAASYY
jgi:hypothetical protein